MGKALKLLGCLLFMLTPVYASYNHSKGLHVELPSNTLDISSKDIEEAQVFRIDSTHSGVMLRLTAKAGARLTTATQSFIGKDVLWIWDGRAIFIQKLTAPLGTDINILNLTTQEAEEVSKLSAIPANF